MLIYPLDPEKLREAKSIEHSLKFLFIKKELYTQMDLIIARNLTEKYKKIMDWDNQLMLGPIFPTE
jgi:hypothetical protein